MQGAIDYCALDRTRLAVLEEAGEDRQERATRSQIQAAYEGVASIDSDDLDEFDPDDWEPEDLAFILAPSSDFNRLEFPQRAEYLRVRLGRPLKRGEDRGAKFSWQNVLPAGRSRSRKPAARAPTRQEERLIEEEKREWAAAVIGPSGEPEDEDGGGAVEEAEAAEFEEEVREQVTEGKERRGKKKGRARPLGEGKREAERLKRDRMKAVRSGMCSTDMERWEMERSGA